MFNVLTECSSPPHNCYDVRRQLIDHVGQSCVLAIRFTVQSDEHGPLQSGLPLPLGSTQFTVIETSYSTLQFFSLVGRPSRTEGPDIHRLRMRQSDKRYYRKTSV